MCGIVGAVAQRDASPILLEGLKRLEYRGYDSAGVAVMSPESVLVRTRVLGKVRKLEEELAKSPPAGGTGIAHTRWATHGKPSTSNAHPHICRDQVALVHNGIIENHDHLRKQQQANGYVFTSETDSEVVVNQVHEFLGRDNNLLEAVMDTVKILEGAYALGVISTTDPDRLIAARRGSPLVIGLGLGENFIASDVFALLPVTQRFIFLQDGDVADITREAITIYDDQGNRVERPVTVSELTVDAADKSGYRHYMLKEIFTQPQAIADTLEGRILKGRVLPGIFGMGGDEIFSKVENVQIIACGTSYHAGMVARYWFESIAGLPCNVEIASEYRYRKSRVQPNSLFVTISQSGETADTLAALELAGKSGYLATLTVCNVAESSLVRGSDLVFMTRAGPEIGVASTKAFTTQLVALLLLVIALGRHNEMTAEGEAKIVNELEGLPGRINNVLEMNDVIGNLAEQFTDKHHALFLGRGTMLPIAMEGALKLKEISYIHAEAYAAGELKHGPLALVDEDMPVITIAPNDVLLEKLKSNMHEVRARGGKLFVFADADAQVEPSEGLQVFRVTSVDDCIAPIVYTVPLQLFAYHVAVLKGADVDQPRNLAKSVTVE